MKENETALPLDDYDGEPTAQSEMAQRDELPEPLIFDVDDLPPLCEKCGERHYRRTHPWRAIRRKS